MQGLRQSTNPRYRLAAIVLMMSTLVLACSLSDLHSTPTPPSVTPVLQASDAAVNAARLLLSHHGTTNPALVSMVRITPTTWLDDCLGLPSGLTCHSKATPGYLIELEKGGQRYLVHTDQDGKQARLAWSPIAPILDVFVQWQYADGQKCKTALIGTEQMRYGICGEAMLAISAKDSMTWRPEIEGQGQASYLKQTYAPFTAKTIRGTLVFSGTGTVLASEAEQRAIAEWALDRWKEADVSYLSADIGLSLFWREETPSLCGALWIYRTGLAVTRDCRGAEVLGASFLSATQLQQFYQWLDSGKRWTISRTTEIERKPLRINLDFGSNDPGRKVTDEDEENVLQFARKVYAGLTKTRTPPMKAEELLAKYNWTVVQKLADHHVTLPTTFEHKPGDFPTAIYWAYNNELSKAIGLNLESYLGKTVVATVYKLEEEWGESFKQRAVVVTYKGQIIGAWIDKGGHYAFAYSLNCKSLEEIVHREWGEWLVKAGIVNVGDVPEQKLAAMTPEQVVSTYYNAIDEQNYPLAYACLSRKAATYYLFSNMGDSDLFNESYAGPFHTGYEQENIRSAKVIGMRPMPSGKGENFVEFEVHLTVKYKKQAPEGSGDMLRFVILTKEINGMGWRISEIGTGP